MERAFKLIEDYNYPTKLSKIQNKLKEYNLDDQTFIELLDRAKDLIIESIRTNYKKKIRAKAENLANRGLNYLFQYGVVELEEDFIMDIKKQFNKYIASYNFDLDIELTKIYYYSKFTKRLLLQTHFVADILKNDLDTLSDPICQNFRNLLDNIGNVPLEKYYISKNIQYSIPNLKNLYPKLQKIFNKMCYKKFLQVFEVYVLRIYTLLEEGFWDNFSPKFLKSVCKILDKYSEKNGYNVYEKKIVSICFNISENGNYGIKEWQNFSTQEKVDAYILFYLILSKEILILKKIPLETYPDLQRPSSREILRSISKEYKIFIEGRDNTDLFLSKGSFNFFKIIESTNPDFLSSQRPSFQIPLNLPPKTEIKKLNQVNSSHIVILISGYLSEDDDHTHQWRNLISLYPNNSFYSYCWNASNYKKLLKSLLKFSFGINHFNKIYENAEIAGSILGQFLWDNQIFNRTSISLVGFSLGTVVAHSCLQYLAHYGQKVHDCILLGSAIDIGAQGYNRDIRDRAVSGMFLNVFCTRDLVLKKVFKLTAGTRAFGIGPVEGMDNLDVTSFVSSHRKYRENLERIFKSIKDF